jgi:hypothetical protein
MPVIKNAIVNWVFTQRTDKYGNYTCAADVDESFVEVLKAGKVKQRIEDIDHAREGETHDPNKQFKFNFKRKSVRGDGVQQAPPEVIDAKKNPMPGVLIGNGSRCNIQYSTYPYGDEGRSAIVLDKIQVIELVEYKRTEKDELDEEEGYTADTTGAI